MLRLDHTEFDYEPYPIGYARGVFPDEQYSQLVASFPGPSLFRFMPELGRKFSLSELNHPAEYERFLAETPVWAEVHDAIKSPAFVHSVLDLLDRRRIDLGLSARLAVINSRRRAAWERLRAVVDVVRHGRAGRVPIRSRFEFSALPVEGGCIAPHTDSPQKLITLVVSMNSAPWPAEFGGGTTVLRPLDPCDNFNHENRYLRFDQVQVVRTYPFVPNQCLVFVKTFNSYHAVLPMTGPAGGPLRQTLTINIETL